jgi:DNA polymerase I-like protein with 3'-5' exonuclease and polymerase domains
VGSCGVPYGGGGLRYNEDTDLSLRALKSGLCTSLFYAFLAKKMPTMRLSGGNTDQLYAGTESTVKAWETHARGGCLACKAEEPWNCDEARRILEPDGRWRMAIALRDAHPDVTTITRKFNRFQHQVDYSSFKKRNTLKLRDGLVIPDEPNEYGMEMKPWNGATDPDPGEPEYEDDEDEPKPRDDFRPSTGPVGPIPRTQIELLSTFATIPRPEGWEPDALEPIPADVREVFLDAETTGLRWWENDRPCGWSVSYRRADDKIISRYYPFGHADGNLDPARVGEWFESELRGRIINNLNTRFDAHMAREWGKDLVAMGCTLRDVGHTQALLDDHRREFNLESLGRDLLGEGKIQGLDLSRGAAVYPAWQIDAYAKQDTVLGVKIADLQAPRIRSEELERVWALESAVMPAVLEMERNAAPIDVEKLRRWVRDSEAELNGLRAELSRVVGWNFNPDSRLDMERMFRERGLESPVRTEPSAKYPDGQQSFTDAVLEALEPREPAIKLMRRVSHLADLRSKFLVPYLETSGGDGLLRYAFHQLRCDREEGGAQGTVSGRFSCTQPVRGVGANVQQVAGVSKQLKRDCAACRAGDSAGRKISLNRHREEGHPEAYLIRELFLPGSGLLAAPDAKQIEFRIFAHFSGSERLAQMYRDDPETDFHAQVGEMVAKMRPDFDRKNVKVLNFGKLFGAGSKKIAEMLRAPEAEVKAFLRTYNQAFPETSQTLRRAMEAAESRGYVRTITGRRVRFPEGCPCGACKTFGPRFHKALNGVVQGTAADIMKMKCAEVYAHRKELGLTLRMTVHDELVCDVPDEDAARKLGQLLDQQSVNLRVPILWSTKWGKTWADCG